MNTHDDTPLTFYLTPPHPCSYLDRNDAQTIFVDPRRLITGRIYQALSDQGFRRSGSHLYRPHCNNCDACTPIRLPVEKFRPNRTQRRVAKRNSGLRVVIEPATFNRRFYSLYERYISLRHADGDMYPASEDQFRTFLLSQWSATQFMSLYDGERLLSVAVTDQTDSGLSAVYTFFEPTLEKRSLGVLSILQQIEWAKSLGLPYLYLGYWIQGSQKMVYKTSYRPLELFVNRRWIPLN